VNCGGRGRRMPPAQREAPMSLNTLVERGRTVADYGRALAERVPFVNAPRYDGRLKSA
jgi:hypothetical protein